MTFTFYPLKQTQIKFKAYVFGYVIEQRKMENGVIYHGLLSGNGCAKFCDGVWTVRGKISHVRWNNDHKLLGSRYLRLRPICIPSAELGSASANH